jgi:arylsulfatase A-like enzyme
MSARRHWPLVGAALGLVAGALLSLVELGYLVATAAGFFDGAGDLASFAVRALTVAGALGAIAGLALGSIAAVADALLLRAVSADRLARARPLAVAICAAPPSLWIALLTFRGPRAQTLPARPLLIALVAIAGVALAWAAARATLAIATHPGTLGRRAHVALTATLAAALVATHVADQKVLPRLYPFFHVALLVAGAAVAGALAATLGAARLAHPSRRTRLTLAAALAAVAAGAPLALRALEADRALRTVALERLPLLGRTLRVAALARPHRSMPRAVATATSAAPRSAARPLPPGPRILDGDVVLITLDAWRADRLRADIAPNLTALADAGVRFTAAYAPVPHTSFSVATLLTGKNVHALCELGVDASAHETLPRLLRRERVKTAAFFPPATFYIDRDKLAAFERSKYDFEYVKLEYLAAPARTDQVIRYFEEEKPPRAFVWVHYFEPHEPYEPHPGITEPSSPTAARYDGEITFVDREVGRLLEWLRTHRRGALVIVAADHGEEHSEHGGHYHGTTLYDEQIRVPLAFTTIGAAPALPARRIAHPVGLVDVAPTLLGLLGVPQPVRMRGQDLSPWLGETPPDEALLGPVFVEIGRKKGVIDGRDKLVCDLEIDDCRLYDLVADPGERRDRTDPGAEAARRRLRALLDGWLDEDARLERAARVDGGKHDAATEALLARGRLGDRAATPGLARLVAGEGAAAGDLALRREAARLIASLPADPTTAPIVATAAGTAGGDALLADWIAIIRTRLGDAGSRAAVAQVVATACAAPVADPERCARAALALGDVDALATSLDRREVADRFDLATALVRALGATHDRRAVDPLLVQLAAVRTRLDVVRALEELGRPEPIPTFARWVAAEPYIPVRAAMATALGRLAAKAGDEERRMAREALEAMIAAGERDREVLDAAHAALTLVRAATQRGARTDSAIHAR